MSYKKVAKDIRDLKIQGATNVAFTALKELKKVKPDEFSKAVKLFYNLRETEPMLRNGLKYIDFKKEQGYSVKEAVDDYISLSDKAIEKTVDVGVKKIRKNSIVMTHCHSSLVMKILKKAHDKGKVKQVYASETRPRFQGRTTAKELTKYGIPVVHYVDSAMRNYVNDVDICLVGADAITADSYLVNKIGTSMLALSAHEARTPFAVAFEMFKFDPLTVEGYNEKIEQRDRKEVWDSKIKKLKVMNPAFDFTPSDYIDFIITEKGISSPEDVHNLARNYYSWMFL